MECSESTAKIRRAKGGPRPLALNQKEEKRYYYLYLPISYHTQGKLAGWVLNGYPTLSKRLTGLHAWSAGTMARAA